MIILSDNCHSPPLLWHVCGRAAEWAYVNTIDESTGSGVDVPTCTTRCPARHNDASDPSSERWNYWGEKWQVNLAWKQRVHATFRILLHAANSRNGTGFYFHSEEDVLSSFSPWKIRCLRPGLNPRTWVPKVSTLPLDHRSRFPTILSSLCRKCKYKMVCIKELTTERFVLTQGGRSQGLPW
jgi:hypothetical protein